MPPSDKQQLKAAADDAGTKPPRRGGWRVFFSVFKWCRITLLLAILSLVVLGLFLNRVGLPEWVKQRIQAQMRSVGWEMEFSRMRLRWYRGIVAEDLQLQRTNAPFGPRLFVETAEFRLNPVSLRHFDLHADSVMVEDGRLFWPLPRTNRPQSTFALNHVQGELFFRPDDVWDLRSLQGTVLGARIRLRGSVTNASLVREWKLPERKPSQTGDSPEEVWKRVFAEARKFRVLGQPEVNAILSLDARDLRSLQASFRLTTLGLNSPWGGGTGVRLSARLLTPLSSNDQVRAELKFNADSARSPWATGTNLQVALTVQPSLTQWVPTNTAIVAELRDVHSPWGQAALARLRIQSQPLLTNADVRMTRLELRADEAQTEWGAAQRAEVGVVSHHSSTNLLPALLEGDAQLWQTRTRWATSGWARIAARFPLPDRDNPFFQTNLAWPQRLRNIPIEAITLVSNFSAPRLLLTHGMASNQWLFPQLNGTMTARAGASDAAIDTTLNVETRELSFATTARVTAQEAAAWIPPEPPRWFTDFDWKAPLDLEVQGRARLPDWTNLPPDWRRELWPVASGAGRWRLGEGAYRKVAFSESSGAFLFTNLLWEIPALQFTRPEGTVEASGSADQRTGDFRGHLRSAIDLMALRPWFPPEPAEPVFRMFEFTAPPLLEADASGNWTNFARFNAAGNVSVTNAVFRKQPVKSVVAQVSYTNSLLSILKPVVLREGETGRCDGIGIDLARLRLHLTNATGNIHPMVIARAIGTQVVEIIEPYVFATPPQMHVDGEVVLTRSDGSERMTFDVLQGGPFRWRNIHLERIQGTVLWDGHQVTLTNLQGRWHGGTVEAGAHFDFAQERGGLFSFHAKVEGADLKPVVMDVQQGRTNRIEGIFDGDLVISQAFCNDLGSWFGYGHAYLRDGLLWDIPIFGVFSQVLNGMVPGIGNSRAKQGSATFQITNSIIYSKDVEIRATAMRMQYDGSLDFDARVSARMEAELFRDTPGLGLVISKVLWPVTKLFEYRVTGTIGDPKVVPIWGVPRIIFFPFQPIKTLKDIFNTGERKPAAPPPPLEPINPKPEPPN